MRIAFIGAGSVGFTQKLVRDILTVPELNETEFSLQDISQDNLEMVKQLLEKDISANGLPAKVLPTTDRAEALEGAKYVINCSRIGGLEAFRHDIEIPLKYGVDQCVGDTVCAGGLNRSRKDRLLILGGYTPDFFQPWFDYEPNPDFLGTLSAEEKPFYNGSRKYHWRKMNRDLTNPKV